MLKEKRIWTIPNILSFFRLVVLIPTLICMYHEERLIALMLIILGIFSDLIDGYIARRWNQCSDLGRMMDPVIDKISVLSAVTLMVIHPGYHFPLWYFIFLIFREIALMISSFIIFKLRSVVLESNRSGKNSAFINSIAVLCFIMGWQPYGWIFMWIAFVLTVYSSWNYYQRFISKIKQKPLLQKD